MLRRTKRLALASLVGACALVGVSTAQAGVIYDTIDTASDTWDTSPLNSPVQIGQKATPGELKRGFYISAAEIDRLAGSTEVAPIANTATGPKGICVGIPAPGPPVCGGSAGMENLVIAGNTYGSDSYFIVDPQAGAALVKKADGTMGPCPPARQINLRLNVTLVRAGGGGELHLNWDLVEPDASAIKDPEPGPNDPYVPIKDDDDQGIDFDGNGGNGMTPLSQKGSTTPAVTAMPIDICG